MVQDKEKLKEVGLSPDKPEGYIRGIWAVTIIVCFAVIIVGGVYFLLWCQPWSTGSNVLIPHKETADWNNYENKTYDFSIKYPQDWQYREFNANFTGVVFYSTEIKTEAQTQNWTTLFEFPGDVALNIEQKKTIEDVLSQFKSESSDCKIEDKKIAGEDGKILECPKTVLNKKVKAKWYLVENNNNVIELFTTDDEQKATLDKMSSTLKFGGVASPSPSPRPSSNHSTYTEKTRGSFSFEYPKDWQIVKSKPYDADAEALELVYKNGDFLNTSYIVIESHKIETGTTDIRQAAGSLLPATNFVSDTQLGGKTALKASGMEAVVSQTKYFVLNNSYLLIVMGRNYEGDANLSSTEQKNKAAFEHILQSWKWL